MHAGRVQEGSMETRDAGMIPREIRDLDVAQGTNGHARRSPRFRVVWTKKLGAGYRGGTPPRSLSKSSEH